MTTSTFPRLEFRIAAAFLAVSALLAMPIPTRAGTPAALRIAPTPTREDFAAHLMAERDYFRAVTVYKELAFFAPDDSTRNRFRAGIATAYRLAGKYDLAIETWEDQLKTGTLAGPDKHRAYLQLSLNHLRLNSWTGADGYLKSIPPGEDEGKVQAVRGLYFGLQEGWEEAASAFAKARPSFPDPGTDQNANAPGAALDSLILWAKAGPGLPRKSPGLAVGLSAVLPGAGQFYCGHPIDGIQALAFVLGASLATYGIYRFDARQHDGYGLTWASVSFTGLLYVANLYGAGRTAAYRNERQGELHRGKMWKLAEGLGF